MEDFPAPGPRLTLTGVPLPAVEAGGLMLDGYLLVGGPRDLLAAGAPVTVTGRVEQGMVTIWQQGTPFVVETAEPAPGQTGDGLLPSE